MANDNGTELAVLVGGGALLVGAFAFLGKGGGGSRPPGGLRSPCPPLGDVDGDGWVSDNDAQLILEHTARLITLNPAQQARGDVDQDGQVTAIDALLIRQFLAGLIDDFSGCAVSAA